VIVLYLCSPEGIHSLASITTGDIQKPKRPGDLFDQNPVQLSVNLAMVQQVVVHELAIELPLLLEQCRRWFVRKRFDWIVLADLDHG
jgi:hypothetical protein